MSDSMQSPKEEVPTPTNSGPRQFRLKLTEVPIILEGVDGVARPFFLRQLDGEGRDEFNEFQRKRYERLPDGKTKILNFIDNYHWLIAKMLHDTTTGKLVPITEVRRYPDDVVEGLYEMCLGIEGQSGKGLEEAKND